MDTNVIDVLFLDGCCGLDFNETPSTVPASMQNVDAHQDTAVLEGTLEECRDFWVRDQLSRDADRLIESFVANLYSTRKQLAGEHSDLAALLDDRLCRTIRLCREVWLVNLKIETLEALATCHEFGFADSHVHRSEFLSLRVRDLDESDRMNFHPLGVIGVLHIASHDANM